MTSDGRGRPKSAVGKKKSNSVMVRLDDQELRKIKAAAAKKGLTAAAWCRMTLKEAAG